MQAPAKLLGAIALVTSLGSVGCSSRPSGSQVNTGIPARTETVFDVAAPLESPGDSSVTSEIGASKESNDGVGSKIAPPIIGQLKSRHHTILIHTSSDGPRFTVSTLDGKVIAAALTMDEMQAQHPEIHKLYKGTFARYDGYLDASNSLDAGLSSVPVPTGSR